MNTHDILSARKGGLVISTVYERLLTCRTRFALSTRELQALTGSSAGHIADVHNEKKSATLAFLQKIAPVYHTTVKWLRDGDPRVNIWPAFKVLPQFHLLGDPGASSADRTMAVLEYVNDVYSGHLQFHDVAKCLGVGPRIVEQIMKGEHRPTKHFMTGLAQLTGVELDWLEMGDTTRIVDAGLSDGMSHDEIRQSILIGAKAKRVGVTLDDLEQMLAIFAKSKGGG